MEIFLARVHDQEDNGDSWLYRSKRIGQKLKGLPESIPRHQNYSTAKGWHYTQLLMSINNTCIITFSHGITARHWRHLWWTSRVTENFEETAVIKRSSSVPTALQQHQSSPLEITHIKKGHSSLEAISSFSVSLCFVPQHTHTHLMSEEQSFELSFTPVVHSICQ